MKKYFVYILSNKYKTVFYTGITNNILNRVTAHKNGVGSKFVKKYNVNQLLYFEEFSSPIKAIQREKQLKKWKQEWKINLIQKLNPDFRDLYTEL